MVPKVLLIAFVVTRKSESQSRTRVIRKSCCRMLVKKCCASSLLTRRGPLCFKTSRSMRYRAYFIPHLFIALNIGPKLQAMQKVPQQPPTSPSQGNVQSPQPQMSPPNQQHPFAMPNPGQLSYPGQHMSMPPMAPMMQMQMNAQYSHPHTIQSVMRNPSPIPVASGPGYMGMNAGF